jgi:hypothetical protein
VACQLAEASKSAQGIVIVVEDGDFHGFYPSPKTA